MRTRRRGVARPRSVGLAVGDPTAATHRTVHAAVPARELRVRRRRRRGSAALHASLRPVYAAGRRVRRFDLWQIAAPAEQDFAQVDQAGDRLLQRRQLARAVPVPMFEPGRSGAVRTALASIGDRTTEAPTHARTPDRSPGLDRLRDADRARAGAGHRQHHLHLDPGRQAADGAARVRAPARPVHGDVHAHRPLAGPGVDRRAGGAAVHGARAGDLRARPDPDRSAACSCYGRAPARSTSRSKARRARSRARRRRPSPR